MRDLKNWSYFKGINQLYENKFYVNKSGGYVYLIKMGESIKIGKTENPINRIRTLNGYFKNYTGLEVEEIWVSNHHANYSENEKTLHDVHKEKRINKGELFTLSLDEVENSMEEIIMEDSSGIEAVDLEREIRNKALNKYSQKRSMGYYEASVSVVLTVINTEYKEILENFLGCVIGHDFEEKLNDLDFVKIMLYTEKIINLIEEDFNFNYISQEMTSLKNDIDYAAMTIIRNSKKIIGLTSSKHN